MKEGVGFEPKRSTKLAYLYTKLYCDLINDLEENVCKEHAQGAV